MISYCVAGHLETKTLSRLLLIIMVLYPFALQERFVRHIGIDVPEVFTEGIDDYTDATDRFVLRMAGKVEDWTLYYAGRCTGDVIYTGAGIIEGVYGFTQAFTGGAAVVGEAISGGGAVLIPGTLAVAAQGVAIAIDGAATITQGLDMMQEDLGRYQESKKSTEPNEKTNPLDDGLGRYKDQGGHHPVAKKAFEGVDGYDPDTVITISDKKLSELGVRHSTIMGQQHSLYSEFAKTVTMDAIKEIEIKALTNSGIPKDYATNAVEKAIADLIEHGVTQPIKIPWN